MPIEPTPDAPPGYRPLREGEIPYLGDIYQPWDDKPWAVAQELTLALVLRAWIMDKDFRVFRPINRDDDATD